jgi:putative DNA primase/helicase
VEKNGIFIIQCPAHDDHSPSGVLKEVTPGGDVVIRCYAGCSFEEIRNALGLPASAFFAHSDGSGGSDGSGRRDNDSAQMPRIVSAYSYRNLLGVEIFQVVRTEPKGFFQRRPDGQGGYINGVANVEMIPYGLPELRAGIIAAKTVFVVEGEKDADAVSALGLVATTNPGGAGKWREAERLQNFYQRPKFPRGVAGKRRTASLRGSGHSMIWAVPLRTGLWQTKTLK